MHFCEEQRTAMYSQTFAPGSVSESVGESTPQHEKLDQHRQHQVCFYPHRNVPFDIDFQLSSLRATAFEPRSGLLIDEGSRYNYSFSSSGPDDKQFEACLGYLNKLEQRCAETGHLPYMLPKLNYAHDTLSLPTEFLSVGFDVERDLVEYNKEVQS